jgi:hypothetical protein
MAPAGEIDPYEDEGRLVAMRPPPTTRTVRRMRQAWGLWAAAAAAALAVAFLALRVLSPWEEPEQVRGPAEGAIQVLVPVGEGAPPRELRWEPVPGARSYEVRIHDQRGRLIWHGTVERPSAALPNPVRESLEPGGIYFWQVEALSLEGALGKSELTQFTIRE